MSASYLVRSHDKQTTISYRQRRRQLKLTQVEVARRTGLPNTTICRFELREIPGYRARRVLDKYYAELEIVEMKRAIPGNMHVASKIILDRVVGADLEQQEEVDELRTSKRLRELFYLHPVEFFESWRRTEGLNTE